jgi:hypothetical protein
MTLIPAGKSGGRVSRSGDAGWAKAVVMATIATLIKDGYASVAGLESGVLELRFATGEIFHLGEETITRIA